MRLLELKIIMYCLNTLNHNLLLCTIIIMTPDNNNPTSMDLYKLLYNYYKPPESILVTPLFLSIIYFI